MQGTGCGVRFASLWWVMAIGLAGAGCNVVAPLDKVQTTRGASRGGDADAGARGGRNSPRDEDSGVETECTLAPLAECDPVAQCGCDKGESCQAAAGRVASCQKVAARGSAREGKRCDRDSDCAQDLVCPSATALCARPCATDTDCLSGSCEQLLDTFGNFETELARVCVQGCDPVSSDGCNDPGTNCVPTRNLAIQESAICHRVQPGLNVVSPGQVGDACEQHFDCARGLGCLATGTDGSGICALWCRGAFDCPTQMPTCQLLGGFYAAPGDQIGQCVPQQTEMIGDVCTVPDDPVTWAGGPVWTVDEFNDCLAICGDTLDNACVTAMCPGGADFVACMGTTLEACAGSPEGPCRPDYAAALCCQRQQCAGAADVPACNQMFCAAPLSTWSMCAGNDQACAETAARTCVDLSNPPAN